MVAARGWMLISGASKGMNTFNIYLILFSPNALQTFNLAILWEVAHDLMFLLWNELQLRGGNL